MTNFTAYYIAGFGVIASIDLLTSAFPLHLYGIFSNTADVGLILGAYAVLSVLWRVPISKFVYGRPLREGLLLGLFLMFFSHVGYIFSAGRAAFLFSRFVFGVGLCGFFLLLLESVNSEIAGPSAPRLYGIFSTIFIVPLLFAPALGVEILRKSGFTVLIIYSLGFFAVSAAAVFFIRKTAGRPSGFEKKIFYELIFRKHPHFVLLFLIIFAYSSIIVFLPILAAEKGLVKFAFAFTFLAVSTILLRVFAARIFERMGMRNCLLAGIILLVFSIFGFRFSGSYPVFFLSAVFYGFGWAFFESNYIPSLVSGSARHSELISMYSTVFDVAYFAGPLLSGIFAGFYGVRNLYAVLPLFCLLGIGYFYKFN
ncbi:MAG: MFS transporter [bacterium]